MSSNKSVDTNTAPNTIINGIKKLRSGTFIILNENGIVDEQSYWYPNASRIENMPKLGSK